MVDVVHIDLVGGRDRHSCQYLPCCGRQYPHTPTCRYQQTNIDGFIRRCRLARKMTLRERYTRFVLVREDDIGGNILHPNPCGRPIIVIPLSILGASVVQRIFVHFCRREHVVHVFASEWRGSCAGSAKMACLGIWTRLGISGRFPHCHRPRGMIFALHLGRLHLTFTPVDHPLRVDFPALKHSLSSEIL